jgi:hypothetical protein
MRLWQKLVLMNVVSVGGCLLLLTLVPGHLPLSVYFVTGILAFGLVNSIAFLGPHLSKGSDDRSERIQMLITLGLIIFAGFLAWMFFRS